MRGPAPDFGGVGHDGVLERRDQLAHAQAAALQIDERINHELTRSVIGDLPAAIDLDHRNVARREDVLALGVESQGKHGRMLEQPDLVGGGGGALVREALHRAPRGLVRHEPEVTNERRNAQAESARTGRSARPCSRPALLRASACSAR